MSNTFHVSCSFFFNFIFDFKIFFLLTVSFKNSSSTVVYCRLTSLPVVDVVVPLTYAQQKKYF